MNQTNEVVPLPQRSQEATSATTPYEQARERLHVSAIPNSLPCRELEFEEIMAHVETAVEEGTGTCVCKLLFVCILMYIGHDAHHSDYFDRHFRSTRNWKDSNCTRSDKTSSVQIRKRSRFAKWA